MKIETELTKGIMGGGAPKVAPPKPMPDEMAPENQEGSRQRYARRRAAGGGGRASTILEDYTRDTMGGS